jgi:hypothetical protein
MGIDTKLRDIQMLAIKNELLRGLKGHIGKPNNASTREKIRIDTEKKLHQLVKE